MSYLDTRLKRLLDNNDLDSYFWLLKQSKQIKSLIVKKFLLLNQGREDFLYQNKIEEEFLNSLFKGQIIENDSTTKILEILNISAEDVKDCAEKSYERAKTLFEQHKKEFNLSSEFILTVNDFNLKNVKLKDIKSREYSLDLNKSIIDFVVEKFHDESSNTYVKDSLSMHENESIFWQSLRQRLQLSFIDVENLSEGVFTVEQISALENYMKPKNIEILINREDYFNFLKENLVAVDSLYEYLLVDFCEYKFYVENLLIPLCDVKQFGEPFSQFFKYFNVGNKKYIATHCSFFIK